MRVKTRALIIIDGRVVVAEERRAGAPHLTLPGGRMARGETLEQATAREVLEETGLQVEVGVLAYLAQVVSGSTVQELNLVFRAVPAGSTAGVRTVGHDDDERDLVMPPILDRVFDDLAAGRAEHPAYLGNIHVSSRGRR